MVEARRRMAHAKLRFVNILGRCRIDGPVEAEDAGRAVGLEALGFGRGGENQGSPCCSKKDEQGDGSIDGAEDGPVGGAGALKAGVDDVFGLVRFVGLRDETAAAGRAHPGGGREMGKRVDGKMADEVGSGVAVDKDLAGGVEGRGQVVEAATAKAARTTKNAIRVLRSRAEGWERGSGAF